MKVDDLIQSGIKEVDDNVWSNQKAMCAIAYGLFAIAKAIASISVKEK